MKRSERSISKRSTEPESGCFTRSMIVPNRRTFMSRLTALTAKSESELTVADRMHLDYYKRLIKRGDQRENLWLGAGNDEIVQTKIYPILCPPIYAEAILAWSRKRGFETASQALFAGKSPHHNTLGDSILRIDNRDHMLGNARFYGTIPELKNEPMVIYTVLWFNEDDAHVSLIHRRTENGYKACEIVSREINQEVARVLAADPMRVISSSGRLRDFGDGRRYDWDDLILSDTKKKILQGMVGSMKQTQRYARFDLPLRRTVLLSGPPGTGKSTAIAVMLASLPQSVKLYIQPEDMNGLLGCAKRLRETLLIIEQLGQPTFLIWEDFQAGLGSRWEGDDLSQSMAFFSEMDGIFARKHTPLCLILTTNHRDVIPAAAMRKGRIDHEVTFELPDEGERLALIQSFAGANTELAEDVSVAARSLTGLSGADLKEIVIRAKMAALERDPEAKVLALTVLDLMRASENFTGEKRRLIGFRK